MMKDEKAPPSLCRNRGEFSNIETNTVYQILECRSDFVLDQLEAFHNAGSAGSHEEDVNRLAGILENAIRSDITYHFIDVSMWAGVILGIVEKASFREIAEKLLR